MLDLDLFKRLVDRAGNDAGEQTLRVIAARFVAALRDSDTVARIGWDEFAALQPEIEDEEDARDMADRLQRALFAPIVIGGESYQIGVTIGIAMFPSHGSDAETVVAAAEQALVRAKSQERGGVVFAGESS